MDIIGGGIKDEAVPSPPICAWLTVCDSTAADHALNRTVSPNHVPLGGSHELGIRFDSFITIYGHMTLDSTPLLPYMDT